jgi:hypothetical protein
MIYNVLLISLIILFIILLYFGIPFLIYLAFKTFGKRKLGKILGVSAFTILILFTTYSIFEDYFYFKFSAENELNKLDVHLDEEFEILKNESYGIRDYYHSFELKISKRDVKKLIQNKDLSSQYVIIKHMDLDRNIWKEVSIDTSSNILKYVYIIN